VNQPSGPRSDRPAPIRRRGLPGFERNRIPGDGFQLLHLLHRDVHPAPNFVICRSTAEFFLQLARRPQELVHALVHVDGDTDGPGLVAMARVIAWRIHQVAYVENL